MTELPIILTAIVVFATAVRQEGRLPKNSWQSLVAFVALLWVSSLSAGTRVEPVVRAFSWLFFLGTVVAVGPGAISRDLTKLRKEAVND